MIALAALTMGLLGSCSKINERLDNLEKKVDGIENEQIASINSQISGITSSISDLGQIRSDISSLKQSASDHSVDIFNLEEADRALADRIVNLEDYMDAVLPNYAEKEWVEATFSTLEQYEATCDTIAKIDARIGALDAKLSNDIKATADSLTKWVNKQFEGYYTAAQMDAKLAQMKADIDSSKASGKISDAKADSIATELTNAKAAVDTAKANIRAEYRAAIDTAIKASEGKLTKELTDKITTVNTAIANLTTRVTNLEKAVDKLTGRVEALEGMIQSVVIVPAYSDGSLEDVEGGILTIDCIISPASASENLKKGDFKVLVSPVKDKQTKAVTLTTAEISDIKIGKNGIVSIFAQAPAKPSAEAYAAALRIKDGANADYTTEFHTFGYSDKNVKVVDWGEPGEEYKKVYIAPSDASKPKDVAGEIPAQIDGRKTFDGNRPTVIEVVGIGTVTFDETAAEQINKNAEGVDIIFFEVTDVTPPGGKQEVVYQVLMKKKTAEGGDVFSVSNAAGEVTMEIPLASNVADVTKVTLLDEEGKPTDGGVVYGSIVYDREKHIITFKVNHFSKYAVSYVLQSEYKPVTSVSIAENLELDNGAVKILTATITPNDATNKNVFWSSSDTTKVKVDKNGKVKAVALGTATITVTTMNLGKTATCEVKVVAPKPYVEIAAKYNGSTTTTLRWYRQSLAITDSGEKAWKGGNGSAVKVPGTNDDVIVGDYFTWGTFVGFYGSGDGSDKGLLPYDSFTNKGCGDGSDGFTFKDGKQFNQTNAPYWSGSAYTKYNAEDGKTTLDASDDVASIILGGTWRMPTSAEIIAMKAATYWKWDETDKGYYVFIPLEGDEGKINNETSNTYDKADALLFFPAAGTGDGTSLYLAGSTGRYWSSTLYSGGTGYAYYLYFYGSGVDSQDYSSRYRGYSVRPVQDPAATYKAVSGVTFDVEKKEVVEGGNVQLSATVSPADATNKGVYWTSNDTTVAKVDALGKVTAVKAGTATITATTVDGTKTATCTVTVTAPVEPEYVEIGGVKWATMNLGAENVTDYGDYFAWGATELAYSSLSSNTFTFVASRPASYGGSGWTQSSGFAEVNTPYYNGSAYTKYTSSDSKTVLESGDDAATALLGSGWRMPTKEEFKALYDACGGSYDKTTNPSGASASVGKGVYWCTSYDGVAGCLFCDGTNRLFFPAAGCGGISQGTSLSYAGSRGYYWSSTCNSSGSASNAYYLIFNTNSVAPQGNTSRYRGFSVRPVKDAAAGVSGNGTEQYNNNSNPDWFSK